MTASIVRTELVILLAVLAGMTGFRILTGRINTVGLLRVLPGSPIDPMRVQMLMGTFIAAGWYLQLVLANRSTVTMPDPPTDLLVLLGGSHVAYLGGKLGSLFGLLTPRK